MFGQEYLITPEFPSYFLDYREKLEEGIRWTDRVQTNDGEWSGNVYDFFTMVYKKVTADFKKPFMTDGPYRVEETPKHLAVREAIANCLANADFFQKGGVVIERYPDRIELSNPGTIILGKGQMLHGGLSEPRNKNILKMFNLIGIGEHAGSGVPDIFEAWRNEKLKDPVVEETFGTDIGDRTKVTLPLVALDLGTSFTTSGEEGGEESGDEKKKLLIAFCEEPRSKAEIQEHLGIKSERYVREKLITPLLKNGDLRRTIPDQPKNRNQKYIVTKTEMERAQAIMDNNPVLHKSPGDLKEERISLEEYLAGFTKPEQEKYRDYYEDEISFSTSSE